MAQQCVDAKLLSDILALVDRTGGDLRLNVLDQDWATDIRWEMSFSSTNAYGPTAAAALAALHLKLQRSGYFAHAERN